MKTKFKIYGLLLMVGVMTGCSKDYLETKPSNEEDAELILSETKFIQAVLDGVYKKLYFFGANKTTGHDNFGQKSNDIALDLMGADMVVHLQGYNWFNRDYQYQEWTLADATNRRPDMAWFYYFDFVQEANEILFRVDSAKGPTATKEALKGQALGLRAYAYYYLINLFQQTYKGNENKPGVPIYLTPTIEAGPRQTVQKVYDQIIADLTEAEKLLTGKSVNAPVEMDVRVIQGFRARVALVQEDWATAQTYANKARQGKALMSVEEYLEGFSSVENPEWMWGSQIGEEQATVYPSFFSHMDVATDGYAALGTQKKITKWLYDRIDDDDVRKAGFRAPGTGNSDYPDYTQTKFHVPEPGSWAADYLYMRAAEMYLIEAEAMARQGLDGDARTVLEALVKARFPGYSAGSLTGGALINEILLQRRIELWGEGFALLDIKRLKTGLTRPTGAGNHGSPNFDPIVYNVPDADPRMIMRLPKREMDTNPNLTPADQNP